MDLPDPKDLSHHYSKVAKRTERSAIKKFYKYFTIPGIGNLAGGLPNPAYFPYETLEARVARPDRFKPTPNDDSVEPEPPSHNGKHHAASSHIVVPHDSAEPDPNRKIELATALEYGTSMGLAPLRLFVREFTRTKMHPDVPYKGGPEVALTDGSTDGINKVLHLLVDNWDAQKDWMRDRPGVLCEEFVYMNTIQALKPKGVNIIPVTVDNQGMLADGPGGLRDVLENWDRSKGKIPHVMYTVTIGQNPTGGTLSVARRKEIYALCSKYDIIIMEDDPYWFLQYPSANQLSIKYRGKPQVAANSDHEEPVKRKSSGSPFLDSLVPSYLSIDTDGRVVRFDTFSKTIAPGCRLGWVTAQPKVIDKVLEITDLATQQPSGFVQTLVAELILGQQHPNNASKTSPQSHLTWQIDGWIRWLEGLRGNYERRMQVTSQILEEGKYHVTTSLASTNESNSRSSIDGFEAVNKTQMYDFFFPTGGMFLWLRMNFENHQLFHNPRCPIERLSFAFWVLLTKPKYLVLIAPGGIFCATDELEKEKGWYYFRLCFAAAAEDSLQRMSQAMVQACNDFFEFDDPKIIDDILKEEEDSDQMNLPQLIGEMGEMSIGLPHYY